MGSKGEVVSGDYSMKIMMAYFERFVGMSGGVEHMLCALANEMVQRGHEVHIVYCYGDKGEVFYPLNKAVQLHNLMSLNPNKWKDPILAHCISNRTKMIREFIRLFNSGKARNYNESAKGKMIAHEIKYFIDKIQPDVIVSFRYETSNYLINLAKVTIPIVTRSFMNPEFMLKNAPEGELKAIKKSAAIHVLVKRDVPVMEKLFPGAHVVWIPNPVPQYEEQANLKRKKKVYTIINLARLNKAQKQQHLLVQAFGKLMKDYPDWKVEIWGNESDAHKSYTKELKKIISDIHGENQIFLMGPTKNVKEKYLYSDIFCFPSAYEGFGNSLAEAMSAGVPPVVFRSCPAVGELVTDQKNGVRCDDGVKGLTAALKDLMDHPEKRARLGQAARDSMKQYSPKHVFDLWENTIKYAAEQGYKNE